MKVAIAADHGGFQLKELLKNGIKTLGHQTMDVGCFSEESVDYPDYGLKAAQLVSEGEADRAILICKSGIGMSIVANKVKGVRGALCLEENMAELSRRHNDANVLILSASFIDQGKAGKIVQKWLETEFEGGRHQRRIDKIKNIENEQCE